MTHPLFRPDIGKIPYGSDFTFQALDWFAEDSDALDLEIEEKNAPKRKYVVTIFGVTKSGNTVSVDVTGYSPQFYIQIPEDWTKENAAKLVNGLRETFAAEMAKRLGPKSKFNPVGDALRGYELIKRKKLMGFDADRFYSFIQLSFYNLSGFRAWVRKFQEPVGETQFEIFETNIDPLLRFIHNRKIKPMGWIKISAGKFDLPDAHDRLSQAYLVADQDALTPVVDDTVAPLLIASFDIEADSSNGDFPMAKRGSKIRKMMLDIMAAAKTSGKLKTARSDDLVHRIKEIIDSRVDGAKSVTMFEKLRSEGVIEDLKSIYDEGHLGSNPSVFVKDDDDDDEKAKPKRPKAKVKDTEETLFNLLNTGLPEIQGDRVIQIGTTFQRYGDPSYSFKHVITLGSCAHIEGVTVQACDSEVQVLMAWKQLIASADPDIITGKQLL